MRDGPPRLPRGRHGLPRASVESSQRERLLAAAARVTGSRGYESTTVADILTAAGVGRETFYELFDDRRDCVLAAHAALLDVLVEQVRDAYGGPGRWVERCRSMIASLLDWLAADAVAARFLVVELAAVGPEFTERFEATFDRLVATLDEGLPSDLPQADFPLPATSFAVGAVIARVYGEIAAGRAANLGLVAPNLTYEVLVPFLGEAPAREAAFGGTARRR